MKKTSIKRNINIKLSQMGLIKMNTSSIKSKKIYNRKKKWDN